MESPADTLRKAIKTKEDLIDMIERQTGLTEEKKMAKLSSLQGQLAALQAKLRREEKAAPPERTPEEIEAAAMEQISYFTDFARKHDYRFIKHSNCFLQRMPDGSHVPVRPMALREAHPELTTDDDKCLFKTAMEADGRVYADATKSFRPQEPWVYNLLSREKWVQPTPGRHHEIFDIVLYSIGGGKDENIEHLERVFRWKYLHPEEFLLPCICIFGQGEVGKNLWVEKVLATIFGHDQVAVLESDFIFGNYNGLMAGKTVVLVNEMVADAVNMEKFKAKVGQNKLPINEKFGLQYECDATALIMTGGNGIMAGVKLANDKSDRRWSILRVTKSLFEHIVDTRCCSLEEAHRWFEENKHHLWDKEQCSHWLYNLIERYKDETMRPLFLDGEDRKWLLSVQKRPWETLCEKVFNPPEFSHINTTLFYSMYKWYSREFQPAVGKLMSDQSFYATVENWLLTHHPEITRRSLHTTGNKETTKLFFAHEDTAWKVPENDFKYMRTDERGHQVFLVE